MKRVQPNLILVGVFCASLCAGAAQVQGATIDLTTASCGGTVCGPLAVPGGTLTLTSSGGNFEYKGLNGAVGLGVNGLTDGEIDPSEAINGTFSGPMSLNAFRLLFIYNGPEFGDPQEIAQVSINGGATVATFTVGAVDNTGTWSLGGATISSCGDTTVTGTGCFDIVNPFGQTPISNFSFTAVHVPSNTGDSDYSLASFDVAQPVPEPATLLLFGTGLTAAIRRARRKTTVKD